MTEDSGLMLTVTEMRVLATAVIHMNVDQIALSIITIPKLKSALHKLLPITAMAQQQQPFKRGQYIKATGNSYPLKRSQVTNSIRLRKTARKTFRQHNEVLAASDNDDSNPVGAYYPSIEEALHTAQPAFPNATDLNNIPAAHEESFTHLPTDITLDNTTPETLTNGLVPPARIAGNQSAMGKQPNSLRAKSSRRVKYITCRICMTIFHNRDLYYDHIKTHAGEANVYTCSHCMFVTKRRQVYNTHILRHSGALPFKCKLCKYGARQRALLKDHMRNHHPNVEQEDTEAHIYPQIKPEPSVATAANGDEMSEGESMQIIHSADNSDNYSALVVNWEQDAG